jgi:hypothetical protein
LVVADVDVDVDVNDDGDDDDDGIYYRLQKTSFTSLWGTFLVTCALIFLLPSVEGEIPLYAQIICIGILHKIL